MKSRIQYTQPSISELEVQYVTDAARYGWGPRCYEYIERFEAAFSRHLGVKYAIATSSCTGALHMGLAALGIGPGDEVILADTNWVASVAPVMYLGAQPVLVDVLPDTWCLDPQAVRAAISPRTKAIIAVHLYGNLCHMDELLALGQEFGIPIIEDAAEAMGSIYQSAAHSTAIVFQNAVQAQRQASICAQAATNQGVMQVYEMGSLVSAAATARIAARPPASNTLETAVMLLVALKMLKL